MMLDLYLGVTRYHLEAQYENTALILVVKFKQTEKRLKVKLSSLRFAIQTEWLPGDTTSSVIFFLIQ